MKQKKRTTWHKMSDTPKTKQKKSLKFRSKKNGKNMLSLSERIKQMKTKESDQVCHIKSAEKISKTRNEHILQNYSPNEKSQENRTVHVESKADINRGKSAKKTKGNKCIKANKRERKPQSLQSTFFPSQIRKSFHDEVIDKQCFSRELLQTKSPEENPAGSTNKMIFVSLDFIEDCQTYKKKFMKPMCGQDLKSLRRSLRNISSYHKRYLNNNAEQIQVSHNDNKTYKQIQRSKNLSQKKTTRNSSPNDSEEKALDFFATEDTTTSRKIGADANVISNEVPLNDELSSQWEKLSAEAFSVKQSFNVKPSSEDVSTVDKKYIELLLSIANCNETKQKLRMKNYESKYNERDGGLVQSDKKKISGKTYFENKIKKEKLEEEKHFEHNQRRLSEIPKKSAELNEAPSISEEGTVFARLVRDLTKSETQILPRKRKNPHSSRNSEIQRAKKTAHSKPEVNDNRKKRKTRNNVLKNNNEDIIEMPFPCEISKVADVKELWRRGSRKKSENSLSSRSASTIQENEEIPECKNVGLESYKILRKIVEEEVKTICKKFVEEKTEKENINLSGNENNQEEHDKDSTKLKKVCKELRTMMTENANDIFDTNGNKTDEVVNGRPTDYEQEKFNPNCERKKERDDFLKYLDKHETEDLDPNLLEEKKNHPNELIKNWSILHRLEQAFLALGTPTFPNHKIKDSGTLKITGTKAFKKSREDVKYREEEFHQKSKNLQKNKDILDRQEKKSPITVTTMNAKYQRDASESRNSKLSPTKTVLQSSRNAKAESGTKRPLQKEKLQGTNNFGTGSQQVGAVGTNSRNVSEDEGKSRQKKGKFQNQKPNLSETKKSPPRSLARPKVCEFESRYSKRDMKQKKCKHNATSKNPLSVKTKSSDAREELCKKKPSKTLVSDSHQIEDENLERKKTFDVIPLEASKIRPRKSKSCNKFDDSPELDNTKKRFPPTRSADSKNLNFWDFSEVRENVDNKVKTDRSKLKSDLTHGTTAKCKSSQSHDRPKTVNEKECSTGNRETGPKALKDRFNHDRRYEKAVPEEDSPRHILERKEIRAVKERSILSMRGNQHGNQTRRKNFLHLQGKTVRSLARQHEPTKSPEKLLLEDTPRDMDTLFDMCAQVNIPQSLSLSGASTCTFDVTDGTLQDNSPELYPQAVIANLNEFEILEELSSLSSLSTCALEQQQNVEKTEIKCLKRQPIWEQDIKQYRALVKEIMSQYKRIDGFLKQNEHSQSFFNDPVCLVSREEVTSDELSKLPRNSQYMNIYEYRKKILSEYQALPIFEYKTKIQQEAGNSKLEEKRRNLSFVKALKTEMDLDVKDYQPNIQKILDSQLYVDTENILKRKEPYVKFSEKKSSLQEIVTSKKEKKVKEEECLRSISTPKTFISLPRAPAHSSSAQNFTRLSTNHDMGIEAQLLKI